MKHSFVSFCVSESNSLGNSIRDAKSIKYFKSILMQFFTLKQRLSFSIHVQIGVKLLKRLRLKFSHLNQLKFRHNFKDCVRPMCNCGTEIEKKKQHFFLALPIPRQWKAYSPWRPLSERSSSYKLWWRIAIKCSTIWLRWV